MGELWLYAQVGSGWVQVQVSIIGYGYGSGSWNARPA